MATTLRHSSSGRKQMSRCPVLHHRLQQHLDFEMVLDYISGFQRESSDGSKITVQGRLELFRNFDEFGNPFSRPRQC